MASGDAAREMQPDGLSGLEEGDIGYADIGVNLTDPVFSGLYHGKQAHESDLADVIRRAKDVGCRALMVTGSDLEASREAVRLAGEWPDICKATIGIHPCSSRIFEDHPNGTQGVLDALASLIRSASVSPSSTTQNDDDDAKTQNNDGQRQQVQNQKQQSLAAIGEIGLDYDRLSLSPKETQLHAFRAQLELLTSVLYPINPTTTTTTGTNISPSTPTTTTNPPKTCPPLFLHSRSSHADFLSLLTTHAPPSLLPNRGVVHSFTGTPSEMHDLLSQGWDIGINGCSVRSREGVDVVKHLPLGRMHLETDAPWCEVRASSAGWQLLLAKLEREEEQGQRAEDADADADANATPLANKNANATTTTTQPTTTTKTKTKAKQDKTAPPSPAAAVYKSVKKEKWMRAALVKGRNEPCRIVEVARIVAAIKDVDVEVVRRAVWANWTRMFGCQ